MSGWVGEGEFLTHSGQVFTASDICLDIPGHLSSQLTFLYSEVTKVDFVDCFFLKGFTI